MRPYLAIVSARFRTLLQYRAAAAAGTGTRIFWGLIRTMIFEAFYRSSTAVQPMTFAQVVTYTWLGQALLAMSLWSVDADVAAMIRTGAVAAELARPVDLYWSWYARCLAARTAPTLMQAAPVALFAVLFFHFGPPPSAASAAAWVLSTFAALLLVTAMATNMTITLLWTISGEGLARMVPALAFVLSGMIVPLPLLPHWIQPIIAVLPFRGLVDVPFRIYMGHITPLDSLPVIAEQLLWTLALIVIGRRILARGLRRLVVQGG